MLTARYYQDDSIESLRLGFRKGHKRQILSAPTGSGKSVIMKLMIQKSLEKGTKVLFLCERRVLVEQFSRHLDAIDIDHGVYMSGHWRYKPSALVQVASIQTIERMEQWPDCEIVFVDEIHACLRKSLLNFMEKFPHVKVVGSTATPFHPVIPQYFTSLTSVVTMKKLVEDGNLVPFKVFISKEIDTEGLKASSTGEWKEADLDSRALMVVGDIVDDYIKISNEIFGEYRKTICFSSGVAHGTELTNKFNESGINAIQISYKDSDEFKKDVLDEFAKEDTDIKVVISSTILERGFDQTDVEHVILARPLRKAFSSFVQMVGRGARIHEGKSFCVIQDNSGNWMRFKKDWDDFYSNGVQELNSGLDTKPRKEPTKGEKEAAKCPKCSHLWPAGSDTCSHCGFVREKRSGILSVPGQLIEVGDTLKAVADERRSFYHQLLSYADEKGYKEGWAYNAYISKFKVKPMWTKEREPVSPAVAGWIRHKQIAYAYAMKKVRR